MRIPITIGCWLLALPQALAQPTGCRDGQPERLELLAWSAEAGRIGPTITFTVRSNLAKPTRSISATLFFVDMQGKRVAEMPLSPDLKIAAGTTSIEDDVVLDAAMNDLLKPDLATAMICTRYVEYADGSFEEF